MKFFTLWLPITLSLSVGELLSAAEWQNPEIREHISRMKNYEWKAKWIWIQGEDGQFEEGARVIKLRKKFELTSGNQSGGQRQIKSAHVHSASYETYKLYINGARASANLDVHASGYVDLVDVTHLLKPGNNLIAVEAANIWTGKHMTQASPDGPTVPGFLFEMEIEFEDGEKLAVLSDETWKLSDKKHAGHFIFDAHKKWMQPELDDSSWETAIVSGPAPYLFAYLPDRLIPRKRFDVDLRKHNGNPAMFINDKPYPAVLNCHDHNKWSPSKPDMVKKLASEGLHIWHWDLWHDWDWESREGKLNGMSAMDKYAGAVLAYDPDALFFPRVYTQAPHWWREQYPEETFKWVHEDGTIDDHGPGHPEYSSYNSEPWRRDAKALFQKMVRHFQNSNYGQRVIGYMVCSGLNAEWGLEATGRPDVSAPMREGFKKWVRERYQNDLNKMRRAYRNNSLTFDSLEVPTPEEAVGSQTSLLRDPATGQKTIDWYHYRSDVSADTVIHFCRAIKEVRPDAICGALWGYAVGWGTGSAWNSGHFAVEKVLKSEWVDTLGSPIHYDDRDRGGADWTQCGLENSFLLNDKIYLSENDVQVSNDPHQRSNIFKRWASYAAIKGMGLWWMEWSFGGREYEYELFGELLKMSASALDLPSKSVSEVAIFFDENAVARQCITPSFEQNSLGVGIRLLYHSLNRTGTPFDMYLLSDLDHAALPDYKVYVFPNAFHQDANLRRQVQRLYRKGKTVLWFYAAGLSRDGQLDAGQIHELTGIDMAVALDESIEPNVSLEPGSHAAVVNLEGRDLLLERISLPKITNGIGDIGYVWNLAPTVYSVDPGATVIGRFASDDRAALVTKKVHSGRSFWFGTYFASADLLRNIFADSGVHIYNRRRDALYVNESYLCVSTVDEGARNVQLPRSADVFDIFENRLVAKNTSSFTVDVPRYTTKLFFVGDYEKHKNSLPGFDDARVAAVVDEQPLPLQRSDTQKVITNNYREDFDKGIAHDYWRRIDTTWFKWKNGHVNVVNHGWNSLGPFLKTDLDELAVSAEFTFTDFVGVDNFGLYLAKTEDHDLESLRDGKEDTYSSIFLHQSGGGSANESFIVELDRAQDIHRIRLFLPSINNSVYQYRVEAAMDLVKNPASSPWRRIVSEPPGGSVGWQEHALPEPERAKFLKLYGVYSKGDSQFRIGELEIIGEENTNLIANGATRLHVDNPRFRQVLNTYLVKDSENYSRRSLWSQGQSTLFNLRQGVPCVLKMRLTSNDFAVKVWETGADEPDWMIKFDAGNFAGLEGPTYVGFFGDTRTTWFDWIEIEDASGSD